MSSKLCTRPSGWLIAALLVATGCGNATNNDALASVGAGGSTSDGGADDARSRADVTTQGDANTDVMATIDSGSQGPSDANMPAEDAAPHVNRPCTTGDGGPAAAGVWENITPRSADGGYAAAPDSFGFGAITLDPHDPSTVYLGGDKTGLYKSTDCGATWAHIDTGTLGSELDKGSVGALVDPVEPDVLYTYSLYGMNGFFKSTNGGVDWKQIFTPDVQPYIPYGGFCGGKAMDPNNHLHLIVTFHDVCKTPYNSSCYAETKDGGTTWTLRNGDAAWTGGEGSFLQFLDSKTWLFSSQTNGMWRTANEGMSWNKVDGAQVSHGAGQLYLHPSGAFFLGSATGILYSADGASWTVVPQSGTLISGVVGDGTTVWSSTAYPYNLPDRPAPFLPYHQALAADPMHWSKVDSPMLSSGGATLAYDADHHILYSANYWDGAYRVVVP